MKNITLAVIAMAFVFIACNSNTDKSKDTKTEKESAPTEQMYACSMHPEVTGKKGDKCPKCGMELSEPVNKPGTSIDQSDTTTIPTVKAAASIKEIVKHYLHIKNALTNDDAGEAANGAKAMDAGLSKVDKSFFTAEQKVIYDQNEEELKEHAEHIEKNGDNIKHQRSHFSMLSEVIYDLVKAFGAGQPIYHDHCPMYNENKGAMWLSETKEVKNPYFGAKMLTCGTVEEVIK